nr:TfuA-related McrA-glycine thioamidation protein [Deltaproteobacteria bacterium]
LGALRAVEFGAHGLQGIGIIHDWYQRGVTIRDDEVVVAMDPETFAARGQPLVNLRYACLHARRCGVIDEAVAGVLLDRYAAIPFAERHYSHLFRLVRSDDGVDPGVLDRFEAYIAARGETLDLKRRDALALVDRIADAFHIVP